MGKSDNLYRHYPDFETKVMSKRSVAVLGEGFRGGCKTEGTNQPLSGNAGSATASLAAENPTAIPSC